MCRTRIPVKHFVANRRFQSFFLVIFLSPTGNYSSAFKHMLNFCVSHLTVLILPNCQKKSTVPHVLYSKPQLLVLIAMTALDGPQTAHVTDTEYMKINW